MSLQRWFAVMCKPRAEGIAQQCLERQGFRTFLPRHSRTSRTAQGMRTRIEPLFPRYLFLRLDPALQSVGPVRSTRGVAQLVQFGTGPCVVPEAVITGIQARIEQDSGLVALAPPALRVGTRVRVTQGPLMGLEGIFLARSGTDRVRVLLGLLGSERAVALPLDCLRSSL